MKKILAILLAVSMLTIPMVGCNGQQKAASSTASGKSYRIGFVVNDLTNPTFAQVATKLKALGKAKNVQVTALDCSSNAGKEITEVENFIQTGMDAIVIQCADPMALKPVLKTAKDKGIKVFAWDDDLQGSDDTAWLLKNYDLGVVIGNAAAKWNNEKLGGKGEIAILNYPSLPILVDRSKGIVDGIKKISPNAKIVAQASAINSTQGMADTETILQAHPNVKIIACIGDGGAVGAAEAVKGAGKLTADFGIFSSDGTDEALSKMIANEAIRMSVSLGTTTSMATDILNITMKLLKGEKVDKIIYRAMTPVTIATAKNYYKQ